MSRAGPSPVRNVTVTIDGVTHHGAYFVQGSMVYVRSTLGAQATQMVAARNNCNVAALGAGARGQALSQSELRIEKF